MAGELITGDWQIEWGGLLFGPGVYGITDVVGLADLPGVVSADRDRLRAHGQIAGDDFLVGRTVEVGLRVEDASSAATHDAIAALSSATVPGSAEAPLVFQLPGVAGGLKARVHARCRERAMPTGSDFRVGIVSCRLQFYATDPRIYSADDTEQWVSLPTGDGGLDVAVTLPANLTAQTESGSLWVWNDGNFPAPWSAHIDGPCTNPVIRNDDTGAFLGFNVTLASDEWLDINTDGARSVMLNGISSQYHTIQPGSTWWDFPPGVTEVAFRASTPSAAQLAVTSRSAWTT